MDQLRCTRWGSKMIDIPVEVAIKAIDYELAKAKKELKIYAVIWDNHEAYEDWNTSVLGYVTNKDDFEKWKLEERQRIFKHYGDYDEFQDKEYSMKELKCFDNNETVR